MDSSVEEPAKRFGLKTLSTALGITIIKHENGELGLVISENKHVSKFIELLSF